MINLLILFTCVLLFILIGIKFGLLSVFATVLSVIALVPFVVSAYLYFGKKPIIEYQIAEKQKFNKRGEWYYKMGIAFTCKKGQYFLNKLIVAPEWGVLQRKPDDWRGPFNISIVDEKNHEAGTIIADGERQIQSKELLYYPLLFATKEELDILKIKFILTTSIDRFRLGFMSIFQPNYHYRCIANVQVKMNEPSTQTGYFISQ
jgi:hypothetical protein